MIKHNKNSLTNLQILYLLTDSLCNSSWGTPSEL